MFKSYKFKSAKSKQVIISNIKLNTSSLMKAPLERKYFVGKIKNDSFKLDLSKYRNKNYIKRNSFSPVVIGKLKENTGGTEISLFFRPAISVIIFSIFWCAFCLICLFASLFEGDGMFTCSFILFMIALLFIFFYVGYTHGKKQILNFFADRILK